MSNCYPTYRTVFDRAMQRQHSDCCLPEKHEPCYPQKSDAPPKRENYATHAGDIYLESKLKSGQPYLSGHPAGLQARDVYLLESKKNILKSGQPYQSGHPAGLQAGDVYLLESKKNILKSGLGNLSAVRRYDPRRPINDVTGNCSVM